MSDKYYRVWITPLHDSAGPGWAFSKDEGQFPRDTGFTWARIDRSPSDAWSIRYTHPEPGMLGTLDGFRLYRNRQVRPLVAIERLAEEAKRPG